MAKFKIGDKVRVLDGSKAEHYVGFWIESMAQFVGKVSKIISILENADSVVYRLEGCSDSLGFFYFSFDENYLEKVEEDEEKAEDDENTYLALEWNDGESGGEVGTMTGLRDINGEKLCIGDVVEIFDEKLKSHGESLVYFDFEEKREAVKGIVAAIYDKTCDGRFEFANKWHIVKRKGFETLEESFMIGALKAVRRKRDE